MGSSGIELSVLTYSWFVNLKLLFYIVIAITVLDAATWNKITQPYLARKFPIPEPFQDKRVY